MANKNNISLQTSLGFTDGALNSRAEISVAVSKSIRQCDKSRWQIAAELSQLTETDITKSMLDHWSGESHEKHNIPAWVADAFCHVTGSNLVKDVIAGQDGTFATGKDAQYLELAKAISRRDRLNNRIEDLQKILL